MSKYSYVLFVIINLIKRNTVFKKKSRKLFTGLLSIYFILKLKFQFKIKKKKRKKTTDMEIAAYIHICLYSDFEMMDCEKNVIFILIIIVEINFITQIFL